MSSIPAEGGVSRVFSFLIPNPVRQGVMVIAVAAAVAAFALSFLTQSPFVMAMSAFLGITGFIGFLSVQDSAKAQQLEANIVSLNGQLKKLVENERKEMEIIHSTLNNQRETNKALTSERVRLQTLQSREKDLSFQLAEAEKVASRFKEETASLKASLQQLESDKKKIEKQAAELVRIHLQIELEVVKSKELTEKERQTFSYLRKKIKDLLDQNETLLKGSPKCSWICFAK